MLPITEILEDRQCKYDNSLASISVKLEIAEEEIMEETYQRVQELLKKYF